MKRQRVRSENGRLVHYYEDQGPRRAYSEPRPERLLRATPVGVDTQRASLASKPQR